MLSRHDIEGYVSEGPPSIKKLRESHHRLARLFAQGERNHDIATITGYSRQRVNDLTRDPMFQELVTYYRRVLDDTWQEGQRDYYAKANQIRDISADLTLDWVQELRDSDTNDIPIRTVMAIHDTFADRTGYGRRQTNINLNLDLKAKLDRALRRTRDVELTLVPKAGEVSPCPPQPGPVSTRVLPAPELSRASSSPVPLRPVRRI